ncbi:sulfite exporter TauE/SafE family protein [Actinomycetaceae bacterium TAE3-ERU4]|nr:sulfite exporter TauE/SafE family protein [Actinomycetaceae bacterium TAE3-ERU4]
MSALIAVLVGLSVGVVVGTLGAGGGILSVPILTYLLMQTPHDATSGSLVIVIVTSFAAIIARERREQIRWGEGVTFALFSSLGAIGGRYLNHLLGEKELFSLFVILLLSVSGFMFRNAYLQRKRERGKGNTQKQLLRKSCKEQKINYFYVGIAGLSTGILTGLFGIGGFVVVPALMIVMKLNVREAAATALLVMIIAASVAIVTGVVRGNFNVDWMVVLLFTAGSSVGGYLGGPLSQRIRQSTLTYIFAFLLVAVGSFTLIKTFLF